MNNSVLKVAVFIPAYNESQNLQFLLESIVSQVEIDFSITEIIISSDGSSDNTVALAKSFPDSRIKILDHSDRQGKVVRMNEVFESFTADILVEFDADVILKNNFVIEELVKPFMQDSKTGLVCGDHKSLQPQTYIEKVAKFSDDVWEQAKTDLGTKADSYRCYGQIRAFSKDFARALIMPPEVGTHEDIYSFYFAKANNYNVVIAPKAVVYFRLVSTFHDYIKQMIRMIPVHNNMGSFFDSQTVQRYNQMTAWGKVVALVKVTVRNRFDLLISFLIIHGIAKFLTLFKKSLVTWDISQSSKVLVTKRK